MKEVEIVENWRAKFLLKGQPLFRDQLIIFTIALELYTYHTHMHICIHIF